MKTLAWKIAILGLGGAMALGAPRISRLAAADEPIPGIVAAGRDVEPPGLADDGKPVSKATSTYLDGLEALSVAKWKEAADNFFKAIDAADNDEPVYFRSRGIAQALAENLSPAIADLRRATKLDPADRETRVWLAAAVGMSGDFMQASSIYQSATLDPYETFVGQIRNDYGQLAFGQKRGDVDPKFIAQRAAAKQRLPQAGAWYASRMKSAASMAPILFQRAKQRFAQKQFAAALADLDDVRTTAPKDPAALYFHAACLLGTGDAATAWQEFTQVLTQFTSFARGYAGRAEAAAQLGDARRARADLAVAVSLRPADAEQFRAAVEKSLAELKEAAPTEKPEALREAIWKSAQSGAAFGQLVEQAAALHKAVLSSRLNDDEVYQQRLKEFEDAVRADPKNPDRLTALAEFLTREAKARYERRAPTGQFRILRREVPRDPEGEFARAERLADEALAINPNHAAALVAKARVCFEFDRFGEADKLLQKALDIQKDVPDGLELYARVITVGASQAEARAQNLETPQTRSTVTTEAFITWTRYPSPEELRQAEEFRAIAAQRLQRAHEIFEEAVKLRPNDATGFFDLGLWRLEQQDLPGAQQALEKAVQLDPRLVRGHQALAKVYRDQGMNDRAFEEESLLVEQAEGAVGDFLDRAWQQMNRTALKQAAKLLAQAAQADPVDARVPAYMAIVRLADDKADEGLADFRLATALEEARLRPRGVTAKQPGTGRCHPEELALLMMLRIRLAELESKSGHAEAALELAMNNLALERRIASGDMLRKLPTSVLPIVGAEVQNRQQPENAASLLAWSHYSAGVALRDRKPADPKHNDDAAAQFQAAFMAGRALPNIMGMEPLIEPRFRGGLALAQILHDRGNLQAARQILDKAAGEANSRERFEEADKARKAMFGGR